MQRESKEAEVNANLYQHLCGLHKNGSDTAIVQAGGRVLTYRDLDEWSARYAHALVAARVRPGDRVAAQVEKSSETLLLYLATLRVGGVFLQGCWLIRDRG